MGVYGIDFYGVGRFGPDPQVIRPDFSVAPFKSTPLDYSTLHLTWHKPVSTDCTSLRLVRNAHNLPQDGGQPPGTTNDSDDPSLTGGVGPQADGFTLFTDSVDRPQSFTDPGLGSGFFYYTMWGWSNTNSIWVRCSDLIGLVPINWGYGWRLYGLLPMAYRDADIVLVDPYNPWPVDSPTPPLQRYLQLIGFQFDFIRTELESLMSINDPQNCSGALLPLLAQQFALVHEPEIGMQQERQLIQNAVHLYKLKGSPRGLTEFASIMTSYPSTSLVHHGYNVMLTQDDSVFADSVGTWQPWPPAPSVVPVPTNPPVQVKTFPTITGSNLGLTMAYNPNMLSGPTSIPNMTNPLSLYPNFNPGPPVYNYSGMAMQAAGTNVIPAPNSSFEDGTVGAWAAGANTTRANYAGLGSVGTHSLGITSTHPNNNATVTYSLSVTPSPAQGTTYLVTADFQSLGNNRNVYLTAQFFNASGTSLGPPNSGPQQTETTGDWVTAIVVGTVPAANATSATITATILNCANNEEHLMDNVWAGRGGQDIYITTGPIPITEFMSSGYGPGNIAFRIQMWSPVARQVNLSLWGDPGTGTPVQIMGETSFNETANTWVMMTISPPKGTINPYPSTAPPGVYPPYGPASYYWIYPRVHIVGVGTESHYMTLCGVWNCTPAQIGVETPVYDYPRDVKIVMSPQQSNLLSNTLTTFTRVNPNPPPAQLGIGFDGLSASSDPTVLPGTLTGTMVVRYQTVEDVLGTIALNGTAALEMDTNGPGATVWFGKVVTFSTPPASPNGWFASPRTSGPTVATLSATLSTAGPITSLPVTALPNSISAGPLTIASGSNLQTWKTTGAAANATSIPVTSQTPNFAYPSTTPVQAPTPVYTDGNTNDWFFGAVMGSATSRPWVDPEPGIPPTNSWFFINGNYFGLGTGIVQGVWFAVPPQPPQTSNPQALQPFNVQAGQPFNFSVFARYQSVMDPSNAQMILGFRWYYSDGTYVETSTTTAITDTYQRYAVAPGASTAYLGEPPAQINPPTGNLPIQVFPFVRFPAAQTASFLLNSAMLSPTVLQPQKYMDATSYSSATGDFIQDPSGASYLYKQRTPRIARLNMELYRWLPMGSTYTINYMSGAVMPPLDPTLWP